MSRYIFFTIRRSFKIDPTLSNITSARYCEVMSPILTSSKLTLCLKATYIHVYFYSTSYRIGHDFISPYTPNISKWQLAIGFTNNLDSSTYIFLNAYSWYEQRSIFNTSLSNFKGEHDFDLAPVNLRCDAGVKLNEWPQCQGVTDPRSYTNKRRYASSTRLNKQGHILSNVMKVITRWLQGAIISAIVEM